MDLPQEIKTVIFFFKNPILDKRLQTKTTNNYLAYKNLLINLKNPCDSASQQTRIDAFILSKSMSFNASVEICNFNVDISCDHKAIIYMDNNDLACKTTEPDEPFDFRPFFRMVN